MSTTVSIGARKLDFWDGFRFAWGATTYIAFVLLLLLIADKIWPNDFDDSDAPPHRSGLRIKTDALTGCQYLLTINSITPRMDKTGKQVCRSHP